MASQRIPKVALHSDESVLKARVAKREHKLLRPVGGWLFLTSRRLLFEPATVQYSKAATDVPLDEVANVQGSSVRLFEKIPYMPWSISIITKSGDDIRFNVGLPASRDEWIQAIQAAALQSRASSSDAELAGATPGARFCSGCGASRQGGKFCSNCGAVFV